MASRAVRLSENTPDFDEVVGIERNVDFFLTLALRPSPPTITTGFRWCVSARWSLHWANVNIVISVLSTQ
jgi:hypothetical protein